MSYFERGVWKNSRGQGNRLNNQGHHNLGRARLALTLAVLCTAIVLLGASFWLPAAHAKFVSAHRIDLRAEQLRGEILRLDEVLTQSTLMACVTGEPRWEKRYRTNEILLDEALAEASKLFPGASIAERTTQANEALVEMEHRALDLVKQGELKSARAILGAEYQVQKESYADGMRRYELAIRQAGSDSLEQSAQEYSALSVAFQVIACISVLGWIWVLYLTYSWQTALLSRNEELKRHSHQLRLLNKKLAESQARLLRAHKMESLGDLAGGLAHNFNNQLQPIITYTELLLQQIQDRSTEEPLRAIRRNAGNCRELVRQLTELANPSLVELECLNLGEHLRSLSASLTRTLPTGISLKLESDQSLWPVKANKAGVGLILTNLVSNSVQAMDGGGQVNIEARNVDAKDRVVEVVVSDSGPGIPDALLASVFEPFFSTKPPEQGNGLGLATAKRLMEEYGGEIVVGNSARGGAEFVLRFPAQPQQIPPSKSQAAILTDRSSGTILFVDDEEPVRVVAQRALGKLGFEVFTAINGQEALELLEEKKVDLVVSDITMPALDGIELARRLGELKPELPVILCSGNPPTLSSKLHISAFLPKPFELNELHAAVRRALDEAARPPEYRL